MPLVGDLEGLRGGSFKGLDCRSAPGRACDARDGRRGGCFNGLEGLPLSSGGVVLRLFRAGSSMARQRVAECGQMCGDGWQLRARCRVAIGGY